MVFNQVISVTEGQTVPEGKTWKVESILMEDFSNSQSSINNTSSYFAQNNPSQSMSVEQPFYDSLNTCWIINANFLPNGGTDVLEKGFCYSSSNSGPTISDNLISSGTGKNDFYASFSVGSQFEPNTNYYVRAYFSNLYGVVYSDVHTINTGNIIIPQIGDSLYGGVVFYIDESGEHGLVISLDLIGQFPWGCQGTYTETSTQLGSGSLNTDEILKFCPQSFTAASEVNDFTNGVYSDWYLPSTNELYLVYENLVENLNYYHYSWYDLWSSSESNADEAYYVRMDHYGQTNNNHKNNRMYFRAVRNF